MSKPLQLTMAVLHGAKDLPAMFELDAVQHNSIQNFMKTTGKNEDAAVMHYEREKLLFFKALQANKKIADCDRFSVYSAWIELQVSGATLSEGHSFLIPYGKQLQFQMGWKGRLEQIQQIPIVKWVNTPIIVWQSEVEDGRFDYEYIEGATTILKHKPILKRPEGDVIAFVYCTIETLSGVKTHLMDRESVLSIRDRYSQPYKTYIAACKEAKVEIGKPVTKQGQYGPYTIEPPFWVTDEQQAFKKTLVKRMYSELPKTARMKALDQKIENNFDPETAIGGESVQDIDYGLAEDKELPQTAQTVTTTEAATTAKTPAPKLKKEKVVKPEPKAEEPAEEANVVEDGPADDQDDSAQPDAANDLPDLGDL